MTDYNVMKYTLEKIATVNAMDYEYQAWARWALAQQSVQQYSATSDHRLMDMPAQQEPAAYTTGHCENHKQKGGCQLHNLQCGWPDCDRKPLTDEQQIAEALRAHGLTLVKTESGYKVLKLGQITALANQPPECQTEAEKTAFAFGWWKALEHIRMNKTGQYSDIVSDGGMDPRN